MQVPRRQEVGEKDLLVTARQPTGRRILRHPTRTRRARRLRGEGHHRLDVERPTGCDGVLVAALPQRLAGAGERDVAQGVAERRGSPSRCRASSATVTGNRSSPRAAPTPRELYARQVGPGSAAARASSRAPPGQSLVDPDLLDRRIDKERPQRSSVPVRKFSTTPSNCSTHVLTRSPVAGWRRSSSTLRFPRLSVFQYKPWP